MDEFLFWMAECRMGQGNLKAAAQIYQELLHEHPKSSRNIAGIPLQEDHLKPVDNRAIIVRMLRNLIGVSNNNEPPETVLRYLNTLILLQPDSPQERLNRALMHMRLKKNEKAKEDVRWLLDNNPPGLNRERLLELFQRL